jgi:hypothetical protein
MTFVEIETPHARMTRCACARTFVDRMFTKLICARFTSVFEVIAHMQRKACVCSACIAG